MRKIILSIFTLILVFSIVGVFQSCTTEPTNKLKITGIEVSTLPSKLDYLEGEMFEPDGLVVSKVLEDGSVVEIDDYVIDIDGPLAYNQQKISIRYGSFQTFINLNVTPYGIKDLEFRSGNTIFDIQYRVSYTDGTEDNEWTSIDADDLKGYKYAEGKLSLQLEILVKNKLVKKDFEVEVNTIDELLTKEVGNVYFVKGVIVAIATTMAKPEYILFDQASNKMIGVYNMHNGGNLNKLELDTNGFMIGDEVVVPVRLNKEEVKEKYSDTGKINCEFVGQNMLENAIVARNVDFTVNKEDATLIDSQEDLVNFLNASNRQENFYKMVKLHGETRYIFYSSSSHYRFFFDKEINKLDLQKIDNCSPCFANGAQHYTTNTTVGDLLFGDPNVKPTGWASPAVSTKDIYALFIGGNSYYHEFVILSSDDVTDGVPSFVGHSFVAPTTLSYTVGQTIDLTGGKIVKQFEFGENTEIALTIDMLNSEDLALLNTVGTHTIRGSFEDFNFSFEVEVIESAGIKELVIDTLPTKITYSHRQGLADLALSGGKIKVVYTDDTFDIVDMTDDMKPLDESPDWCIGEVIYTLTYLTFTCELPVTFVNEAISVSEFLKKTEGTFDVCGIVYGPLSSMGAIELLIKDKVTSEVIGVWNTGVCGTYDSPKLDESILKVGDEIIVKVGAVVASAKGGNKGKQIAQGTNAQTFKENLIVVSHNNSTKLTINEDLVITIATQQDLIDFINREDRFFKIVKLVMPKVVNYGTAPKGGLRIFFGDDVTSLPSQKINEYSPYIQRANTFTYLPDGLDAIFTNSSSGDYSNPGTTDATIYAMFFGGSTYYHIFTILDPTWVVRPSA